MAITTRAGLLTAMANQKTSAFNKIALASAVGGTFTLFRTAGRPAAAAIPGTAAGQTLSRTSAGALDIPAASAVSYITGFRSSNSVASTLLLADRLVETGTLSGLLITAQTVNSVALPSRATGATDVELWLEILTAVGGTASPTVTASYTNQSGTAGRTATLEGGIPTSGGGINRTYPMALQAPDTGVQSVQSVTLGTSTGAAGAMGIVLRRTLLLCPTAYATATFTQNFAETDLQIVADDACLELYCAATTSNTGAVQGYVSVAQG